MRILVVCNCPAVLHLGSGYVIKGFADGFSRAGHHVKLLQPNDFEILKFMGGRGSRYRRAIGMLFVVKRQLEEEPYDIIEFWGGEAWLATLWLRWKGGKRPLIVQHTNGPEPRYARMLDDLKVGRISWFERLYSCGIVMYAFDGADAVVTVSEYDRRWLVENGKVSEAQVIAINNPLLECFRGREKKIRGEKIVGFCGTWLPKKGIYNFIEVVSRLLDEYPDWRVLILGAGGDPKISREFPVHLRVRIEVMDTIVDKEVLAEQYERMSIFVMPSLIESFGIALAEAMACGCAPVVTNVGFGASLQSGKSALVVERLDSSALYGAVRKLIEDEYLRSEISKEAQMRVQNLNWDSAVEELEEAYLSWIGRPVR